MGCSASSVRSTSTFAGVRLVHINGYIEDFPGPVTVREVTGKPPGLVCFSPLQLLTFGSRPLGLDERLQPGRLYFLLPHSVLQSDASAVDLAALATRLTALARNGGGAAAASPSFPRDRAFNSPLGHRAEAEPAWKPDFGGGYAFAMGGGARPMSSRVRSWKPILDTIEERSFRPSTAEETSTHGLSSGSSGR